MRRKNAYASHVFFKLVLFSGSLFSVVVFATWSSKSLRMYDDLRKSGAFFEIRNGSNVIHVKLPKSRRQMNASTASSIESVDNSTSSHNNKDASTVRLCHLSSLIGATRGKDRLNQRASFTSQAASLLATLHFNHKIATVVPELQSRESLRQCNHKLTIDYYDSNQNPLVASRTYLQNALQRNHSLSSPLPCAVVGSGMSIVTSQISLINSIPGIPTISGTSISVELDDKEMHPYFGRTVPNTDYHVDAAISYFREVLGVMHCSIFYVRDRYGTSVHREFTQAAERMDPPMEVASAAYDDVEGNETILVALEQLLESGFNYVFAVINPTNQDRVVTLAKQSTLLGPGRYWLFAPSTCKLLMDGFKYPAGLMASGMDGVGILTHDVRRNNAFEETWGTLEKDSVFKEYFLSKQPKHIQYDNYTFPTTPMFWYSFVYDAVMAIGIAACELEALTNTTESFFSGPALFNSFRNVAFTGASGKVQINPLTGSRDGRAIPFRVTNVVARPPNANHEVFYNKTVVAQQVVLSHEKNDPQERPSFTWQVINQTQFADHTNNPPPALPPPTIKIRSIGTAARGFGIALALLIMLLSIFWALYTFRYRHTSTIRSSQPEFLAMLCAGTFVMATSVFPFGLQGFFETKEGMNLACMATPWLFQVGFIMAFSALLAKMQRINKIFLTGSFRRVVVKPRDVIKPFFLLLIASLIFLATWTAVEPLTYTRTVLSSDQYGRPMEIYISCSIPDPIRLLPFVVPLLSLNVILIFFANCQAYKARKIRSEYSESRFVAMSMASILQAFIVGVPALWAMIYNSNPNGFFIVSTVLVALVCLAILLPMFVPKMKLNMGITRTPDKELRSPSGIKLLPSRRESRMIRLSRANGQDMEPAAKFVRRAVAGR